MSRGSLIGFGLGALITIPFLSLVVFCAGGGHGTYAPAKLLFPIAMVCAITRESITTPIVVVALVQFPLYGLVLGSLYRSRRFRYYAIGLAILHLVLATVAFLRSDEAFS